MKQYFYEYIRAAARLSPRFLRKSLRRYFPATNYDLYLAAQANPFFNEPDSWEAPDSEFTLGIVKEFTQYHKHYIRACREMGVSYRLMDLSRNDWMDSFSQSICDCFLIWPSASLAVWKEMFDERLYCLVKEMGKNIYPSLDEILLYENKRRVSYFLAAHQIPHPATRVFYDESEALAFIQNSDLPLILKTNTGASASGVFILENRPQAERYIRQAFSKGIVARRHNPNDRHWGYVLLQEFVDIRREWRMVRIGDSFFGHPKGRRGNYHSGSGIVHWDVPPERLLEFTREVTEVGGFSSMDVDVFETMNGDYLVNELQTVFGAGYSVDQLMVNGKSGRFVYNHIGRCWAFEEGDFARNACANARIEYVIDHLLSKKEKN